MHVNSSPPKRVLLYRLGSLGDMLIALPSLHLVARAFPDAERRLLTNVPVSAKAPAAAAIFDGMTVPASDGTRRPLLSGYFRYTMGTRNPIELFRLRRQIVRFRPDVLVYLAAQRGIAAAQRDARFFRLCGIPRLIGVPLTMAMQNNFYGADTDENCRNNREPAAQRLVRNLAELGDARLDNRASWDLDLSTAEHEAALAAIHNQLPNPPDSGLVDAGPLPLDPRPLALDRRLRGAIAVSVGTKVQAKDWGRENWRALLTAVAHEFPGRTLLLAGASEEAEASEFAAAAWCEQGGGPVVNLCGLLTPRQSAAAFSCAELFLGHDSGPMHLAAAVGTPCIAIFAARNIPRQWFPYGRGHRVLYHPVDCMGCGLETCIVERKKCILSITVGEVMAQVRAALSPLQVSEAGSQSQ